MSKSVVFIVGPTGSGKSKLALMLARKLGAEIISADSMQIYRGMNVGTAKPTKKEQKLVSHHLLDSITSRAECSVFKYQYLALRAIRKIASKGHLPIVVGGSGLYIKALIDGLSPLPGRRAKFRKQLKQTDAGQLYAQLRKLNPARASKIHPNDQKRIIRALEIIDRSKNSEAYLDKKTFGLGKYGFEPVIFGLNRNRKELYRRIEKRVDQMFEKSWVNEVKRLKKNGLSQTARCAIGYKEILEYLDNKKSEEEIKSEIKKRTRHLAKRQMTWFRKDRRIKWYFVSGEKYTLAFHNILKTLKKEFTDAL